MGRASPPLGLGVGLALGYGVWAVQHPDAAREHAAAVSFVAKGFINVSAAIFDAIVIGTVEAIVPGPAEIVLVKGVVRRKRDTSGAQRKKFAVRDQ